MQHNEEQLHRTKDQRELGSRFLKQADSFVKRQNYSAALDSIRSAQLADPLNPYCPAYEELVRSLLRHSSEQAQTERSIVAESIRQYLIRAELFVSNGKLTDALEEVANATTISPDDPDIDRLRNLIISQLKEDRTQDRRYRISVAKKLQINPRHPIDGL